MYICNLKKAAISYQHQDKIQYLFNKHVKGNLEIGHFSLNIFFGNGQSIFLSPTPQMAEELCKHNFVNEDSNYNPEVYQKFSLYPWRSVQRHETDRTINFIKEEKFGMRSGIMIIRNLGCGRYAMYSVATQKPDHPDFQGQFYFLFHCKANYIAQLGDFLYDNLLPIINQYGNKAGVNMPKIDQFVPINLESGFYNDSQRDIFENTQNRSNNIIQLIRKKNPATLKLINAGKIFN